MAEQVAAEVKTVLLYSFDSMGTMQLADFAPVDPTHFGVALQAFIGEPGDSLVDSFDFVICSPTWFAERAASSRGWTQLSGHQHETGSEDVLVGTGFWFMRRWSPTEVDAVLADVCSAAGGGPDWGSVASRIGRAIPWEYDYQYDAHVDVNYGAPFPAPR